MFPRSLSQAVTARSVKGRAVIADFALLRPQANAAAGSLGSAVVLRSPYSSSRVSFSNTLLTRSLLPLVIQRGTLLRTDSTPSSPDLTPDPRHSGQNPSPKSAPVLLSARRDFGADDPELYEKIRRAVVKACPAWMGQRREDLAQKAVLRVLERAKRSPDEARFCSSYLYRTAYSVVVDEIRSIRRREGNDASEGQELVEQRATANTSHSDPEYQAQDNRLGAAIRACLAGLKYERRLALTLNLQGYSNPDAAKMLDWDPKRTENLTVRGRSDLRRCLESKGFGI